MPSFITVFYIKVLFANCVDADQTQCYAASELGPR